MIALRARILNADLAVDRTNNMASQNQYDQQNHIGSVCLSSEYSSRSGAFSSKNKRRPALFSPCADEKRSGARSYIRNF
ncbi:hypothetical protein EVAR_84729_1 [Eumeta japonica]|uniref:Uncharacterized protein n=1 Tax=Eumeta variegata TaxID=151549 RepID=A0A4C1VU85_EUMVA|nr:hypothetical protein EVAR_84729_1 [Eumeta japonica]